MNWARNLPGSNKNLELAKVHYRLKCGKQWVYSLGALMSGVGWELWQNLVAVVGRSGKT